MYKLFIADDDFHVRDGLKNCIDWDRYGIKVVGTAANGKEAYSQILNLKPDIVITDVMMPKMNGIEMAQKLTENKIDAKIIFISGYDDLEYVRASLRLSALDYILKPVQPQKIYQVLDRVLKIVDAKRQETARMYRMEQFITESIPLLRQNFFFSLTKGKSYSDDVLREKLRLLQLDFTPAGSFCVLLMSVQTRTKELESMDEAWRQYISVTILQMCRELISEKFCSYVFESIDDDDEYIAVISIEKEGFEECLIQMGEQIKSEVKKHLLLDIVLSMGEIVDSLTRLNESYSSARRAMSDKSLSLLGNISIDSLNSENIKQIKNYASIWQKTEELIEAANKESIDKYFEELFNDIPGAGTPNSRLLLNVCMQLLLCALLVSMKLELKDINQHYDEKKAIDKLMSFENAEDMKQYILNYYHEICDIISSKRKTNSENLVQNVKDIIRRDFGKPLTVQDIAAEINYTYTYVCMAFKRETGMTVNNYLSMVRLEKAKEMMGTGNYKLHDVAYLVGYQDAGYFSKQFKRYMGVSPSEYVSDRWKKNEKT